MSFYYSVNASLQSIVFTRLKNRISSPPESDQCISYPPTSSFNSPRLSAWGAESSWGMSAKELFSDKKDGSLSKKDGVCWSFVVAAGAEQKTSAVFIIRSRQQVLFTSPPAARKRMLFLKKKTTITLL